VSLRIPDATELNQREPSDSDLNVLRPDFSDFSDSGVPGKSPATERGKAKKEPQIEFLCPNGHRLFGPVSLQGKPGECPECGSRFYIPICEGVSIDSGSTLRLNRSEVRGHSAVPPATIAEQTAAQSPTVEPPADADRMAALVARLWRVRPKGAAVELRLRGGETLVPSEFLEKASRDSRQGVFATTEADGTVSLVAVSWDAVERITVRGLKELPAELRD
jgi:hypothetical protein